jgi:pimeloyl-ACP methyl ester carboxylesterase
VSLSRLAAAACCLASIARAQQPATPWQANAVPIIAHQPFNFTNAGIKLAGTLYLPEHGDRLPAIVVFWDAQGATRDYALYKQLANGLPAIGVAVLVFDRRGSGESGGNNAHSTFDDLAGDGIAALHALQHHPRIDPRRIGFWGLSQGGWLAILAASKTPDAAFAISCSAPLVTPSHQMTFAVRNMFTVRGYGAQALEEALRLRQMQADYNAGHGTREAMVDSLRRASSQLWFKDAFLRTVDEVATTTPDTAWLRVMDYDPIRPLEAVRVPVLIFYGGADPWVPVAASIGRLEPIAARNHNITYFVVPGADHMLAFPKQETMDWDSKTLLESQSESTEYFLMMGQWLTRRLGLTAN